MADGEARNKNVILYMESMNDINDSKALIFEDEEGRFTLSPRGCFASSLIDTSISESDISEIFSDQKFDSAFMTLVGRFRRAGFLKYDDEPNNKEKTREDQMNLFASTVLGFYPKATKEQIEAAFDLFFILLEKHGNTVKNK